MTAPAGSLVVRGRQISAPALLAVLAAVVVLAALLAPAFDPQAPPGATTYSAGPEGTRLLYDLASRMGWRALRREAPLDSTSAPAVEVVIAPGEPLGAVETHRLLDNVRRGGGLLFEIDGGSEIADSLGVFAGLGDVFLTLASEPVAECGTPAFPATSSAFLNLPPRVHPLRWRRPAPGITTPIVVPAGRMGPVTAGLTFRLGAGRVALLAGGQVAVNSSVRYCPFRADIVVARALEALWPPGAAHPPLVFDEFHHGYGAHGGSMHAVALYLSRTASGHFLAQALVAAFLLLLAKAPRAIVPREPERIVRRSPLEHAEALAYAYADTGATRTAAARLVSGLRRRAGRVVAVRAADDDAVFLDAVVRRTPAAAARVAVVRRALDAPIPPSELLEVGEAISALEAQLTMPSSSRT